MNCMSTVWQRANHASRRNYTRDILGTSQSIRRLLGVVWASLSSWVWSRYLPKSQLVYTSARLAFYIRPDLKGCTSLPSLR